MARTKFDPAAPYNQAVRTIHERSGRIARTAHSPAALVRPYADRGASGESSAYGDVAAPSWRSSAVGVYRLWRDLGYVAGALVAGITADALGFTGAIWIVAALTFLSGLLVAFRMTETLPRPVVTL